MRSRGRGQILTHAYIQLWRTPANSKEAPQISTDDLVSKTHDTEKTDAVENKEKWGGGCFFGL